MHRANSVRHDINNGQSKPANCQSDKTINNVAIGRGDNDQHQLATVAKSHPNSSRQRNDSYLSNSNNCSSSIKACASDGDLKSNVKTSINNKNIRNNNNNNRNRNENLAARTDSVQILIKVEDDTINGHTNDITTNTTTTSNADASKNQEFVNNRNNRNKQSLFGNHNSGSSQCNESSTELNQAIKQRETNLIDIETTDDESPSANVRQSDSGNDVSNLRRSSSSSR